MSQKSRLLYDRFYTFAEKVATEQNLSKDIVLLIRSHVGLSKEDFEKKIDSLEVKLYSSQKSVPYHELRKTYNERMFIWGLFEMRPSTDGGWGQVQLLHQECLYKDQKAKVHAAYKLYDEARGKHNEELQRKRDEIKKVKAELEEFMGKPACAAAKKKIPLPSSQPSQPPTRPPRIHVITAVSCPSLASM